jgi:hypothetical protein
MHEFFLSNHFIALAVGALIFLTTVFLASKELINFPLTVLFLLFALAASLGIENYDLFRMMEKHRSPDSQLSALEQILIDNKEMKEEMGIQSQKLQNLINSTELFIQRTGVESKPNPSSPSSVPLEDKRN